MTSVGIQAFGGYVPRRRLQRSVIVESNAWFNPGLKRFGAGERAIASWDEDAVTMAVEAARDALGKVARDSVRGVYLASTSLPFSIGRIPESSAKHSVLGANCGRWTLVGPSAPARPP